MSEVDTRSLGTAWRRKREMEVTGVVSGAAQSVCVIEHLYMEN